MADIIWWKYISYIFVFGILGMIIEKNGGDAKLTFLVIILALIYSGGVK